jgi:type VI secretion system protein VasJ
MKSLRHDTLRAIPAPDAQGRTRIEPPRADQRALLKRLYLQQNWAEMLETADSTFLAVPITCGWICSGISTRR